MITITNKTKRMRVFLVPHEILCKAKGRCHCDISADHKCAGVVSSLIPHKSPGRLTFADITLERGATKDKDLYDWFADVANTASGLGLVEPGYKRNMDIVQLDRDGSELRRWTVMNAWPTKFVAGDWDNSTDDNLVESVTLAYDFFELA